MVRWRARALLLYWLSLLRVPVARLLVRSLLLLELSLVVELSVRS